MIEWIPIKEFLKKEEDEDETFLFYDKKNCRVVTTSLDTINRENLWSEFTHAACINFPVQQTLEEKFEEFQYEQSWGVTMKTLRQGFAQIAKEHYEGKR